MIKYKGIIDNAVTETQNYLNKILPQTNYLVKEGEQISTHLIDIDVYVKQPINPREIKTLVAELSHLEEQSEAFKYRIKEIPAEEKVFFNEKTNPKFVGLYPGV